MWSGGLDEVRWGNRVRALHLCLSGKFLFGDLDLSGLLVLGLHSDFSAAPLPPHVRVLVVVLPAKVLQVLQVFQVLHRSVKPRSGLLYLFSDFGECEAGDVLLVDNFSESLHAYVSHSSTLDKAVGDFLLLAQSGQVQNQLDRLHVVRYYHQLRLVVLHQRRHVVQPELRHHRLLVLVSLVLLIILDGFGFLLETLPLFLPALSPVLHEEREEALGCIGVQRVAELVQHWGNFQSSEQNALLPLNAHVPRPLHKPRQVTLRLNVIADAEVLGSLNKERVVVAAASFGSGLSGGDLFSFGLLLRLH